MVSSLLKMIAFLIFIRRTTKGYVFSANVNITIVLYDIVSENKSMEHLITQVKKVFFSFLSKIYKWKLPESESPCSVTYITPAHSGQNCHATWKTGKSQGI